MTDGWPLLIICGLLNGLWQPSLAAAAVAVLATGAGLGAGLLVANQDLLPVQQVHLGLWAAVPPFVLGQRSVLGAGSGLLGSLVVAGLLPSALIGPTVVATLISAFACRLLSPALGLPQAVAPGQPWRRLHQAATGLSVGWWCYVRSKLIFDPLYRRLLQQERPWGRVLDVGCGCGLVAAVVGTASTVTGYVGMDLDPAKLAVARHLLTRLGRPMGLAWQLVPGRFPEQTPQGTFDTLILCDILHYWSPDEQTRILAALVARLAPGGRLLLREGERGAPGSAWVRRGERLASILAFNPDGTFFPSAAELEARLAAVGLTVERHEACGGANRLWICHAANR